MVSKRLGLLVVVLIVGATLLLLRSDRLLFELPDEYIRNYCERISDTLIKDGVYALWTFGEKDVIEWANGHREYNYSTSHEPGHFGPARHFSGKKGSRVITKTAIDSFGPHYTISTWIKIYPTGGDQHIIGGNEAFRKPLWLNKGRLSFEIYDKQLSYAFSKYGEFVHIAAVFDLNKQKATIFENGILMGEANIVVPTGKKIARWRAAGEDEFVVFGNFHQGNPADYVLDETVIWQRALSGEEIKRLAASRYSYLSQVAGSKLIKMKVCTLARSLSNALLNGLALFDPFNRRTGVPPEGLNSINLVLSKKDQRYFNKKHNACLESGCFSCGYSEERKVSARINDVLVKAHMSLLPSPVYEDDTFERSLPGELLVRKAYRLELSGTNRIANISKFNLYPVENVGFVLPLLANQLMEKCGWQPFSAGLIRVTINGVPEGLYYYEKEDDPQNVYRGVRRKGLLALIQKMPLLKESILEEYDSLVKRLVPTVAADINSPFSSRMIEYELRAIRRELKALESPQDQTTTVARLVNNLAERCYLGSNLASSYIMADLNFTPRQIGGVYVDWKSKSTNVVDDAGRILQRPSTGGYISAVVEARFWEKGSTKCAGVKRYEVCVVPTNCDVPVLRMYVGPGEITRNQIKNRCLMKYGNADYSTDYIACGIELRGNDSIRFRKKPFHIKTEKVCRLPGLYETKDFFLRACSEDHSFMHEKLSYELFTSIGGTNSHYQLPHIKYVELFINDKYCGLYLLGETITGLLLKTPEYDKNAKRNCLLYFAKNSPSSFTTAKYYFQKRPSWQCMAGDCLGPIVDMVEFVHGSTTNQFVEEVSKRFDLDEIIDYHVLLNFACNTDGMDNNLYFARDASRDSKFYIVPWDYEYSFNGKADVPLCNYLLMRLLDSYPGYKDNLCRRWIELRRNQMSDENILAKIDLIEKEISRSVQRNDKACRVLDMKTFKCDVDELRAWLGAHLTYMDSYFARLRSLPALSADWRKIGK